MSAAAHARIAESAYGKRADLERAGWTYIENGPSVAIVRRNGAVVEVAFPGTNDVQDAFRDLDARLHPLGIGRRAVHAGFQRSWRDVGSDVETTISDAADGDRVTLKFIGHSLGGAMAVCAAHEFRGWAGGVQIITFGGPRVGNAAFVAALDHVHWERWVNCLDGVTRVPPAVSGNYRHGGDVRFLTHDGRMLRAPGWWATLTARLKAASYRPSKWALRSAVDHSMAEYVRKIEGLGE